MSSPFFPNPLGDFEPKRPDFEPETDPDYDDNLEENCPVCNEQLGVHTTREIVLCALKGIQGGK